jgi:hypothetical protein
MRLVWHAARIWVRETQTKFKSEIHLGDLDEEGRTRLTWILIGIGVRVWSGFIWLRQAVVYTVMKPRVP